MNKEKDISEITNTIKSNVSPVQVVEYYTGQKVRYGKFVCPFHDDHNPSLTVKGDHWRCWSCHTSGDVIDFVQRLFNIGFVEAMHKLNDDFHLGISFKADSRTEPLEKLWGLVERDIRRHTKHEIENYRAEIDAEIDMLTITHRALLHAGADENILQQYADELDTLIIYREKI